jgi:phosphohistidine phosphatase
MKTLFIMRHAKSSWDDSALADFDRPLNERGLEAAPLIGETIRQHQFQIDSVVSSPAKRAEQTALLVRTAARINCEIQFDRGIYEASPQRLRQIVAMVLDVDSDKLDDFNETDAEGLQKIVEIIEKII